MCKKKISKALILGLLITSISTILPKAQIVQAASKNNINYIKTEFNIKLADGIMTILGVLI